MKNYILAFGLLSTISILPQALSAKPSITVDGSSTVFPISEAVGEEFQILNRSVQVAVASSGTGGGFKKFCKGEVDITGASRPIEASEMKMCQAAKIEFVELPVAYDGIAIVVNPKNDWAKSLTTAELKKIWTSGSTIKNWNEVRSTFPNQRLTLFGPGPDSGTFDYFTKVINEKEKLSRTDFSASESDNVIVNGVANDKGAMGYFGYAYYEANKSKLNLVSVDAGKGAIVPTPQTIGNGTYAPLSRPIFVYVSATALKRPEVKAFAEFYVKNAHTLVPQVGYISLGDSLYALSLERLVSVKTGSVFESHAPEASVSLMDKMKAKTAKQ